MKKILLSVTILAVAAGLAVWGSTAFFSDTEESTGNVFQAGAIDLKVDNESYYNGVLSEDTTWDIRDLTVERFFNFTDLKPGDWGEDTISFHVNSNPAYVCANIQITDNSDNGFSEPEDEVDGNIDDADGTTEGDLAAELNFIFWVDDGDNELESGEQVIMQGPASDLLQSGATYALADASGNIFTSEMGGIEPNTDHYIAKAWCYGDWLTDDGGIPECDGTPVGNISQTDRLLADISFYAVQERNNEEFLCSELQWDSPTVVYQDLENKDLSWQVIDDDIYGTIAYSSNAGNFYGVVQGRGLEANSKYQITLNGPGTCSLVDNNLVSMGTNLFESGYWNNWAPNLSDTCTGSPGEGVYNMNLTDDWYTFISDNDGNFVYPFNLSLAAGDYTGVKVIVKKMLDTHESPWIDSTVEHTTNLFETAAISFTVL